MKIFFLHFFNSCIPVSHDNTFTIEKRGYLPLILISTFSAYEKLKGFLSQKIKKILYISSAMLKHYRREYRQCDISFTNHVSHQINEEIFTLFYTRTIVFC